MTEIMCLHDEISKMLPSLVKSLKYKLPIPRAQRVPRTSP